jgi:hypothetical protein
MYPMYKILLFIFISTQIFAQTFKQKIVDEWVKDNISLYDGSPILKDDIRNMQLRYTFMENDSFQITINGKTGRSAYQVKNDTLYFAKNVAFKIERLDDIKLVFRAVILDSVDQSKALRLSFIPARFHNSAALMSLLVSLLDVNILLLVELSGALTTLGVIRFFCFIMLELSILFMLLTGATGSFTVFSTSLLLANVAVLLVSTL